MYSISKIVYRTEKCQVWHGDCLEIMDGFIKQGLKATLIADIPYGTTACGWDTVIPFDEMWKRVRPLAEDNPVVLFAKEPFTSQLINSNAAHFKERIDWLKNKAGNGFQAAQKHLSVIEDICVFCNSSTYTFHP